MQNEEVKNKATEGFMSETFKEQTIEDAVDAAFEEGRKVGACETARAVLKEYETWSQNLNSPTNMAQVCINILKSEEK